MRRERSVSLRVEVFVKGAVDANRQPELAAVSRRARRHRQSHVPFCRVPAAHRVRRRDLIVLGSEGRGGEGDGARGKQNRNGRNGETDHQGS